jgi:hypothetical protein
VYPVSAGERISRLAASVLRGGLALVGVIALGLTFLWAVPSSQVARAESYRLACDRALSDGLLTSNLGRALDCQTVPAFYRLDQEDQGDIYEFWVEGPLGQARVRAEVRDGAVQRFRVIKLDPGWLR